MKKLRKFKGLKLTMDKNTSLVPWSKVAVCWGWETSHLLIGNPYNGYTNPYYWVDEFIPYYMEIMGV